MTTLPHETRLTRPRRTVLSGVSAGLAEHLGLPPALVRAVFVITSLLGGGGALLYLWLWALTPLRADGLEGGSRVRRSVPVALLLLLGAGASVIITLYAALSYRPAVLYFFGVLATMLAAAAAAWSIRVDPNDETRSRGYNRSIMLVGGLLLAGAGVILLARSDPALGVVMLVVGLGLLAVPRIVRLWTDLMGERAARVREVQRAEIAAHLHDSVLQTLALIQNRAGTSSEIARLARAQERELRDWLYAGSTPLASDLAGELRELAASIELESPARIDVVTVGEVVENVDSALVAAAREAMLNAARHAGGEISVYIEASARAIDVFVRDRGPGFDLDTLPSDRLGVRESIIGRMARAGGTATVRATATGTEVHLRLDREREHG